MDFEADIHLTVRVPFKANVDALELELEEKENGKQGLVDAAAHEKRAANIERQRAQVAKAAIALAKQLVVNSGEIVGSYVEEVRER